MNPETQRRPSRRTVVPPAVALRRVTRLAKWTLRKWPEHPAVVSSLVPFLMTGADPAGGITLLSGTAGYRPPRLTDNAVLELLHRLISDAIHKREHILEARVTTVVFGLWRSRFTTDIEPMYRNLETGKLYRIH